MWSLDQLRADQGPRVIVRDEGGASVEVVRRRAPERAAGVAALEPGSWVPETLPNVSDFSLVAATAAYWMIGADLFMGTAAQVLRDARSELLVPDSAMIWSPGLLDRARAMARTRNPSVLLPEMPGPGDMRLPAAWLKVVLWLTYSAAPVLLSSVALPVATTLPALGGAEWEEPSGAVEVFHNFDPRLLADNPFRVARADEVVVTGGGGGGGGSSASGGGGLVALALLALGVAVSREGR